MVPIAEQPTHHLDLGFDLPKGVVLPLEEQEDVRRAAVFRLYDRGTITMLQAATIIGCTRREFEEMLPDYGYTMMDERDFESEMEYVQNA